MPLEELAPSGTTNLYSKTEQSLLEQGYEFSSMFKATTSDALFSVALLLSHQFSVAKRISFHAERHGNFIRILNRNEPDSLPPPPLDDEKNPESKSGDSLPPLFQQTHEGHHSSGPPPLHPRGDSATAQDEFAESERPTRADTPSVRVTEPGRPEIPENTSPASDEEDTGSVDDSELIEENT